MSKKLTSNGIAKNNARVVPVTEVVDYGIARESNTRKSWDERIRTLMTDFGFTKKEKKTHLIDMVIKDTNLEAKPNATDKEKYNIAHRKFKKLLKEQLEQFA